MIISFGDHSKQCNDAPLQRTMLVKVYEIYKRNKKLQTDLDCSLGKQHTTGAEVHLLYPSQHKLFCILVSYLNAIIRTLLTKFMKFM